MKRVYSFERTLGNKPQRSFSVKLRRFKIIDKRRSKKSKQFLLKTNLFGFRELEIRYNKKTVNKNNKSKKSTTENSQYSRLFKQAPLTIVLLAIGIFGSVHFGSTASFKSANTLDNSSLPAQAEKFASNSNIIGDDTELDINASYPANFSIPSVAIENPVDSVGLNSDNTLETPAIGREVVGWYKNSKTPGENGTAVFVGHVDTYKGPSVFYDLAQAKVGAEIVINRMDETKMIYEITALEEYSQDNFPSERVYANTNYPSLRVITCSGSFSRSKGHYSHNTVVYARLKNEQDKKNIVANQSLVRVFNNVSSNQPDYARLYSSLNPVPFL